MSVGSLSGAAAAAGNINVLISNQTLIGAASGGGSSSAGIRLLRNGQYHAGAHNSSINPTYSDVGGLEWASKEYTAVGDLYEARLVTISGTLSSGTVDTWQAISSTLEYNVQQVGVGVKTFTGTLEIRRGTTTLDTAAIDLTATSVP
jgi:hypothetical protein